jgi:hypothetical protein
MSAECSHWKELPCSRIKAPYEYENSWRCAAGGAGYFFARLEQKHVRLTTHKLKILPTRSLPGDK